MSKKKLSKLKEIIIVSSMLYSFNASFLPVLSWAFRFPGNIRNPRIQEVMKTKKYVYDFKGDDQEVALKYLKLAHAITMKHMMLGNNKFGATTDDYLDTRLGNCTETSKFTYSNFLSLISESDNIHLAEYVREAGGIAYTDNDGGGHEWLEFKLNGKWVPYETTENDLGKYAEIDPASIDELVKDSNVLNIPYFDYHRTNICQIKKGGKKVHRLDIKGIITNYRGFAYTLYKLFSR